MIGMSKRTLDALKKSIEHWRGNVEAENPINIRLGTAYCGLCRLFHGTYRKDDRKKTCEGCPVAVRSCAKGCQNTPYDAADDAHDAWGDAVDNGAGPEDTAFIDARTKWRAAAQAELDFLISLLPEGCANG